MLWDQQTQELKWVKVKNYSMVCVLIPMKNQSTKFQA